MKRWLKRTALVTALLSLPFGLTACSNSATGVDLNDDMHHDSSHSMPITDRQSFALAMIPHHQQAIDLAELAFKNSSNPDLLALASQIQSEQAAEITKMTAWLDGKAPDMTMTMEGMLSPEQIFTLSNYNGPLFDKTWANFMYLHHMGAIEMANKVLELDDKDLADFGRDIISQQGIELDALAKLGKQ